jgi:hypothetical protein
MFDEQEKAFLTKLTTGLVAEIKKLRGELQELRGELDEVERIMTGHIQSGHAAGRTNRGSGYHGRATVEVSEELRRVLARNK